MTTWAVALCSAALLAQQQVPDATVRGTLLCWDNGPVGNVSVRVKDNHVYCFRFDGGTTVERDGRSVGITGLEPGDIVEVSPGEGLNRWLHRAAAIRVLHSRPSVRTARPRPRTYLTDLDDLFPRGDLLLAGEVSAIDKGMLRLRTRARGEVCVVLREDTRYVDNGQIAALSMLQVNRRVFVRGGRTLDNEIEAYQVAWGSILLPRRSDPPPAPRSRPDEEAPGPVPAAQPDGEPRWDHLLY